MDKELGEILSRIEIDLLKITDENLRKEIEKELITLRKRFEGGEIGDGIKNDIISLSVSASMQASGLKESSYLYKWKRC